MTEPVLQATDIRKSFGGVRALKGVSLALGRGEVHALVGENGAGKSTLLKILTGALAPDSGTVHLHGKLVEHNSPAKARELGIAVVYQQPALFPELTVAENIALANDGVSWRKRVSWSERRERAAKLLLRVGARIQPDRVASSLSMPEQQLVEIAKAIERNPSVLILDEPTASLGESDTEQLFRIIAELREAGAAIVYVSHRFEELFRIASRVTVLRDGCSIEDRAMAETTSGDLIRSMVGRDLTAVYPKREAQIGGAALVAAGVCCRTTGVREVSLAVRRGEVLGLAGLVGSGRTQFAEALFGLTPMDGGTVSIDGAAVQIRSPRDAMRHGLAYLPEDRRRHGVVLAMSVASNTTMASLPEISSRGFLRFEAERDAAQRYVSQLAVKTPSIETRTGDLSGGNQQKVALARWLMTKPKVMILDEPTQGIDVGAKAEIYDLIGRMAAEGVAILMISSDMPELLAMSDRIAVMSKGRIAGTLTRDEATPFRLLEMALGHDVTAVSGESIQ